ncbi:ENR1 protein, partial [Rhabdornis inornatus]|nr:ENR1 protein [Rhabdornis inornatus]
KTRTILSRRNLFIDLVERISHEFNVTDCWICGDTRMDEIWPWEEIALNPQEILKLLKKREGESGKDERDDEEVWSLRLEVTGKECLWRRGAQRHSYVDELSCKRYLVTSDTHHWWIPRAPNLYWATEQGQGCSY